MCALAQVKPAFLRRLAFPLWVLGVILLIVVDITGHIGKGAQRWLDLGFIRFQPSEIMKLAVPMTCAWWLHERPLPPNWKSLLVLAVHHPASRPALTILQPDLGTGGLILIGGMMVVIMAGLQFRVIFGLAAAGAAAGWFAWQYVLYDYQKQRVFTLLDPESDKLGAGYHIIQSQIAIGSGGVFGKGLLNGSQGQLEFLPERTTDFIYAMVGRGTRTARRHHPPAPLSVRRRTRPVPGGRNAGHLRAFAGRQHCADLLRLRVHQCRHGQRTAAGCRRAATVGQLRRHIDGDPAGGLRYPDVPLFASEARCLVIRRIR